MLEAHGFPFKVGEVYRGGKKKMIAAMVHECGYMAKILN